MPASNEVEDDNYRNFDRSQQKALMDTQQFFEKLKQNQRPVVVDFWAPWCGPCRMVKPTLEKLSQEYEGRVDFWEVNADESQDLLRTLKVYGIPTLVAYESGTEKVRYVGAKPAGVLKSLFESLSTGQAPEPNQLSTRDRFLRLILGTTILGVGWNLHYNWLLLIIGGVLMFSAIYDRCPIWKAITTQFKKATAR
jgi:thioredoxin 1